MARRPPRAPAKADLQLDVLARWDGQGWPHSTGLANYALWVQVYAPLNDQPPTASKQRGNMSA